MLCVCGVHVLRCGWFCLFPIVIKIDKKWWSFNCLRFVINVWKFHIDSLLHSTKWREVKVIWCLLGIERVYRVKVSSFFIHLDFCFNKSWNFIFFLPLPLLLALCPYSTIILHAHTHTLIFQPNGNAWKIRRTYLKKKYIKLHLARLHCRTTDRYSRRCMQLLTISYTNQPTQVFCAKIQIRDSDKCWMRKERERNHDKKKQFRTISRITTEWMQCISTFPFDFILSFCFISL